MNQNLRRVARRLPSPAQAALRRAEQSPSLRRSLQRVRWGSLRRLEPVSPFWGSERGTPIDRYYIARFMASHAPATPGRVLEVRDPQYSGRFATKPVSREPSALRRPNPFLETPSRFWKAPPTTILPSERTITL